LNIFSKIKKNYRSIILVLKDYRTYKLKNNDSERFKLSLRNIRIILNNRSDYSFDSHYVLHTAWASRILSKTKPETHVDISSSLFFNAIVSAFIPIKFYDFHPVELNLKNLSSDFADLLKLPFYDCSIDSLSCMHVVEHIGLGRYGDPINPEGDLIAIKELKRVLAKNGNLLFAAPLGKSKLVFNAHRIYSYEQIIEYFRDLGLIEFSIITDVLSQGGLLKKPDLGFVKTQKYACGCFWFRKN